LSLYAITSISKSDILDLSLISSSVIEDNVPGKNTAPGRVRKTKQNKKKKLH
jgi:hypothetical protein